jgi:hypothetical protein
MKTWFMCLILPAFVQWMAEKSGRISGAHIPKVSREVHRHAPDGEGRIDRGDGYEYSFVTQGQLHRTAELNNQWQPLKNEYAGLQEKITAFNTLCRKKAVEKITVSVGE